MVPQKISPHCLNNSGGVNQRFARVSIKTAALGHAIAAEGAAKEHFGKFLGRLYPAFEQALRDDCFPPGVEMVKPRG
jgi:hypothetical protein